MTYEAATKSYKNLSNNIRFALQVKLGVTNLPVSIADESCINYISFNGVS